IRNDGTVLDTWYPSPQLGSLPADRDPHIAPADLEELLGDDPRRGVRLEFVTTRLSLDAAPVSTADVYLRLHLLSHRLVLPNTVNLDGVFGLLPTVVWTNAGPMHPDDAARLRAPLQRAGISAHSVDKFPRLVDYV